MDLLPKRFADTVVLHPLGRINHTSAEDFKAALQPFVEACRAGGDQIVLDLSEVEYISSAGLRVLMLALKQAKAHGGAFVVTQLTPIVQEIFEISKFTMVFEVFASVRDALARVSPAAAAAFDAV